MLQSKVISASFADPFILLLRDDASAVILTIDERGEIDEARRSVEGQWLSGSLYEDSNDVLRLDFPEDDEDEAGNVLMFLLSATGGLQVCYEYSLSFFDDFPYLRMLVFS